MTDNICKYSRYRRSERKMINETACQKNLENRSYSSTTHINPDPASTCSRIAYQRATVNVPVFVRPFTFVGPANTYCCDEPVIANLHCKPHRNKQVCCFTISQDICVEIPVHFGAQACAGESWVDCHSSSAKSCGDCDTKQQ